LENLDEKVYDFDEKVFLVSKDGCMKKENASPNFK